MRVRLGLLTLLASLGMALTLPALAATKTVDLTADNKYSPASLTVVAGDKVEFNWRGGFHDVTFSDGTKSGAPTGETGVLYSRTFVSPGTYNFRCTVHEALGMKGTITVSAAGGTTTTSAAPGNSATTSTSRAMPNTGPEDSMIPLAGLALVAMGATGLVIVRRLGT